MKPLATPGKTTVAKQGPRPAASRKRVVSRDSKASSFVTMAAAASYLGVRLESIKELVADKSIASKLQGATLLVAREDMVRYRRRVNRARATAFTALNAQIRAAGLDDGRFCGETR